MIISLTQMGSSLYNHCKESWSPFIFPKLKSSWIPDSCAPDPLWLRRVPPTIEDVCWCLVLVNLGQNVVSLLCSVDKELNLVSKIITSTSNKDSLLTLVGSHCAVCNDQPFIMLSREVHPCPGVLKSNCKTWLEYGDPPSWHPSFFFEQHAVNWIC